MGGGINKPLDMPHRNRLVFLYQLPAPSVRGLVKRGRTRGRRRELGGGLSRLIKQDRRKEGTHIILLFPHFQVLIGGQGDLFSGFL